MKLDSKIVVEYQRRSLPRGMCAVTWPQGPT